MRTLRLSVLLCALLCGPGALADEGVSQPRRVTPPGDADSSLVASSGVTANRGGPRLSNLLSAVLCLAGGIWMWRGRARGTAIENGGLWNVISQWPLDARHRLMVVRFADSLLLLSVSPNQVALIKEIDDPAQIAEVNSRVSGRQQAPSNSLRKKLMALGFPQGTA